MSNIAAETETPAPDGPLYMAVRTDNGFNSYLMKDGMTKVEAEDYLRAITARQRKPHGQDYSLYDYTPATRASRICELRLIV